MAAVEPTATYNQEHVALLFGWKDADGIFHPIKETDGALHVKMDGSVVISDVSINNWIEFFLTLTDGIITRDVNGRVSTISETDPLTGDGKVTTFTRDAQGRVTDWSEVAI